MKTRVEQGLDHVTITCSPAFANALGSAIVASVDSWDSRNQEEDFFIRVGIALESGNDFEEDEPPHA